MADPFDALHRPLESAEVPAELRERVLAELWGAAAERAQHPGPSRTGAPAQTQATEVVPHMKTLTPQQASPKRALPLIAAAAAVALVVAAAIVFSRRDDDRIRTIDTDTTAVTTTAVTTTAATTTAVSSTTPAPAAGNLPPIEGFEAAGAQSFPTGRQPQFVTVGGGGVWINRTAQPLLWLDSTTGRELGTVPINGNQTQDARAVVGFGSLWVQEPRTGLLHRVDVGTGAVQASIPIPGGFLRSTSWMPDPALGDDGVWVLSQAQPRQLVKIDPTTNAIVASWSAGEVATTIAYGAGSLWVTRGVTLSRIDPATGSEQATIELPTSFDYVLVDDSGVWLYGNNPSLASVAHIDPATNELIAQIAVSATADPFTGYDMAVGGGYIWLVTAEALLVKIDPATDRVVARYGDISGGGGVAADDTAVWVASYRDGTVYRLPLG